MSRSFFFVSLAALAGLTACAGSRYAEPAQPVARLIERPAAAPVPRGSEQQLAPNEGDSEARRAWFEQEIERARYVPPPPPVETRIVYERVPYDDGYYVRQPDCRYDDGPSFPINTAAGASLGAIIGNQSGHCDEGALIGAGIGLLFDFARW